MTKRGPGTSDRADWPAWRDAVGALGVAEKRGPCVIIDTNGDLGQWTGPSPGDGDGTPGLGEPRLLIHPVLDYRRNEFRDDATIMVRERRPRSQPG